MSVLAYWLIFIFLWPITLIYKAADYVGSQIQRLYFVSKGRGGQISSVSGGTLILDYPTVRMRTTDLWWTPDRVAHIAPVAQMGRKSADILSSRASFDKWCYHRYIDRRTGSAQLLSARSGFRFLTNQWANLAEVDITSALSGRARYQERHADRATNEGSPGEYSEGALRSRLRRKVRKEFVGMLDYIRFPDLMAVGPFNFQLQRHLIFRELVSEIPFVALVETGTSYGSTTDLFRRCTSLPVYSVEHDARRYAFAKLRFLRHGLVHLTLGDSREFLVDVLKNKDLRERPTFFYLDAHEQDCLPLRDELRVIFGSCSKAVVMIDDFRVPDDDGYGIGEYGIDLIPSLEYLSPLESHRFRCFFPAVSSAFETGAGRGCAVLVQDQDVAAQIGRMKTLREWPESSDPTPARDSTNAGHSIAEV